MQFIPDYFQTFLMVYVVAVWKQTMNVDCSIQNGSNPVQAVVKYDLNLKYVDILFSFSSILNFNSIAILLSKINFHWWAQEVLRKSNNPDSFYMIYSFFTEKIKGGKKGRSCILHGRIKRRWRNIIRKACTTGPPLRDERVHGKILWKPVARNNL